MHFYANKRKEFRTKNSNDNNTCIKTAISDFPPGKTKAPLEMRILNMCVCVTFTGALTQFQSRDIGPAVKMWPTLSRYYLIFVILSVITTGNATSSFVRNGKILFKHPV